MLENRHFWRHRMSHLLASSVTSTTKATEVQQRAMEVIIKNTQNVHHSKRPETMSTTENVKRVCKSVRLGAEYEIILVKDNKEIFVVVSWPDACAEPECKIYK